MSKQSVLAILLATLLFACTTERDQPPAQEATDVEPSKYPVASAQGKSWLNQLAVTVSDTSMGQMGGTGPIPGTARREPELTQQHGLRSVMRRFFSQLRANPDHASRVLNESFTLTGTDLYRLSCQSCHGPEGKGDTPEIQPLLGPVQGTSPVLIRERLKRRRVPINEELVERLAAEAKSSLLDRIRHGGDKMPPFDHLRGDEVETLIRYLQDLAAVPPPQREELLVSESAARVGEHVIKGTCHICHDATGPGGGHMAMMRGIIPSLASFPRDHSLSAVTRQVEFGSSRMMMMMNQQRMPPMPYFTEEEIAAAYYYLVGYPPHP